MNKLLVLFFALNLVFASCDNSSSDESNIEKEDTEAASDRDFQIIGKWVMFEDQDLDRKRGTFIFKSDGEVVMIRNVKNQDAFRSRSANKREHLYGFETVVKRECPVLFLRRLLRLLLRLSL